MHASMRSMPSLTLTRKQTRPTCLGHDAPLYRACTYTLDGEGGGDGREEEEKKKPQRCVCLALLQRVFVVTPMFPVRLWLHPVVEVHSILSLCHSVYALVTSSHIVCVVHS